MSDTPDEIGTEEIVAWRGLDIRRRAGRVQLVSHTNRNFVWQPDRWTVARCWRVDKPGHIAPMWDCTCGLYAARSRELFEDEFAAYGQPNSRDDPTIIAQVGLSGKVVVSKHVYRAQQGRVMGLYVSHIFWRLVEPLQITYRVPVSLFNPFDVEGR
ncbi:MAG: hypothetical protein ABR529_06650 [Actinomycetota bacterium]